MIKNELYKVFIRNRFVLYVLLFLILKLVSLVIFEPCINTDIELVHDDYTEYISQFEGELTPYASNTISQDYSSMIAAGEEYTALKADYESGLIASDYYTKEAAELNSILKNKEVISLAYEQLEFVKENPRQRHFIYNNGWEAFIANEKLDYALISAIILFTLFLFTLDYDSETFSIMAVSRNGRTNAFYLKQLILAVFIILINIFLMSEEMLFYGIKYGISHFEAPLQSLVSFRESSLNISIIEAVLIIILFKTAGSILLAEFTVLIGYVVKKLWITAAVSGLVIFIPYAVFNNKIPRYYFQPLGLILGNGYIKGECEFIFRDGLLISEPFEGIEVSVLYSMLIAVAITTFIIYMVSLKIQMLNSKNLSCGKLAASFICLASVPALLIFSIFSSSIKDTVKFNSVYSKGMGFSDNQYCYFNDNALTAIDYSTEEQFNVIRDVMKNKKADLYYVSDKYIYYLHKDTDSGQMCYYRIDKKDYKEKLIYKEIKGIRNYNIDSKYLGLINTINISNVSSDYYENEEIYSFWVDDKYIFTADSNGINKINTENGTTESIIETAIYTECLAYNKGTIYYADLMNNVFSYNVNSEITQKLNIENCKKLFIAGGELIVIDFDYRIGVYKDSVFWIENTLLSPTSYVTSSEEKMIFVNDINQPVSVNLSNLSTEILIENINVFNMVAFENTSKIYVYTKSGQDYLWKFVST